MATQDNFKNETLGGSRKTNKYVDKVHYLGQLRIIGIVVDYSDLSEIIGYVIMDEKKQTFKMFSVSQTATLIQKFKFVNAKIDNGKIVNTECAMDRILKFNTTMQPIGNPGITIIAEIYNSNNKMLGYKVMDANGKFGELTEKDILRLHKDGVSILNGKVVNNSNGNEYISAIKSTFTRIERSTPVKEESISDLTFDNITSADRWRFQRYRRKIYANYVTIMSNFLKSEVIKPAKYDLIIYESKKMKAGLNFKKNFKIAYSEIIPKIVKNEADREIFKKALSMYKISSDVISSPRYYTYTHDDLMLLLVFSQLCLYMGEYNSTRAEFVTSSDDGYYKYFNQRINKALRYAMTSKSRSFGTESDYYKELKENGLVTSVLEKMIKDIDLSRVKYSRTLRKPFNTVNFSTAEEIAQLGFAVSSENDGIQYKTHNNSKYTLKDISKYIYARDVYYNKYKKYATCLGDLLSIAIVDSIIVEDEFEPGGTTAHYTYKLTVQHIRFISDIMHGSEKYKLTKEDLYAKAEIILAFMAIYNPELCKVYIQDRLEMSSVDCNAHKFLSRVLPDFDFDNPVDYDIDDSAELYYSSGFCVYYNDMKNSYDGKVIYSRDHLMNAKYINYRALGPKKIIKHKKLYEDIAPIIAMITSSECDGALIEKNIGNLRIL